MKRFNKRIFIGLGVLTVFVGMFSFKADERNFEIAKNLDVYNAIFKELDMFYVDTINPEKVIGYGIDAMLSQIDPYTTYYPEGKQEDLKMMTKGQYAGIGSIIRYNKTKARSVVSEPYENMPAAKAGLKAGDVLLAFDGKDLKGKTNEEVSKMLRGEPGTSFVLKVQRPGTAKPLSFKLTRENIQTPCIPYYGLVAPHTGYILLTGFIENSARDVRRAVIDLKNQGMTSLIIDLRDNGGGSMPEAVDIVGMFVPKGTEVLSQKGKLKQMNRVSKTTQEPLDLNIPLAILVNENTASASEIVSGSLQDMDRAVVVGNRTYGKGLVQVIRPLPYNGSLKVTTSRYYIPSGRCIQAIDYKNRNAEGEAVRIPDSLTHVFHTAAGRLVRDGGGIRPDVEVKEEKMPTLLFYIENDDVLFDYATDYCLSHKTIAPAEKFVLSDADYDAFKTRLQKSDFKYDRQSVKMLEKLKEVAKFEGYDEVAAPEFKALEKKLNHDLTADLAHFKKEIKALISNEIVKRYYYQKGSVELALQDDKDLKEALKLLGNGPRYKSILTVAKKTK